MTNKETGVYYVHRSKLFASGIYGLGTILLCKDGNEYRVHFLRRDSRELMEDVYATEVEPLVNPTKVAFIKPLNRFLPELKEIMIFCDNEDGGVVLDPTTFTKTVSFREKVNAECPHGNARSTYYSPHAHWYSFLRCSSPQPSPSVSRAKARSFTSRNV